MVAHPESFTLRREALDYYQWTKETWPHSAEEIQRRMAAIAKYDVSEAIRSIRVPTLVITGAQDILMPVENSRRIAERIPGARLALIEGGAHIFFLEQAEAMARELVAHFEARSSAASAVPRLDSDGDLLHPCLVPPLSRRAVQPRTVVERALRGGDVGGACPSTPRAPIPAGRGRRRS